MDFEDRLDPEVRGTLSSMQARDSSSFSLQDIATAARSMPMPLPFVKSPELKITDIQLPNGESQFLVRVYQPVSLKPSKMPTVLWIHGGGFFTGSVEHNDPLCQAFALAANCAVVAMDYRKAPEHPYPAGFDDCYACLEWVSQDPLFDPESIVVAGMSAGACLAAGAALKSRDIKGPKIKAQMLIIPVIDDRMITKSSQSVHDTRVWNTGLATKAWQGYLGDLAERDIPSYAAPARATSLEGLPPAFISVEAEDLLRDEGLSYAQRLLDEGVKTELHLYPGAFHGSLVFAPKAKLSQTHMNTIMEALKRLLHT